MHTHTHTHTQTHCCRQTHTSTHQLRSSRPPSASTSCPGAQTAKIPEEEKKNHPMRRFMEIPLMCHQRGGDRRETGGRQRGRTAERKFTPAALWRNNQCSGVDAEPAAAVRTRSGLYNVGYHVRFGVTHGAVRVSISSCRTTRGGERRRGRETEYLYSSSRRRRSGR